MRALKYLLLFCLIFMFLSGTLLASEPYTKKSYEGSLRMKIMLDLFRFMEMGETTLKKTGLEPGKIAGVYNKISTTLGLDWNIDVTVYRNLRVYLAAWRADVEAKGLSDKEFSDLVKKYINELPNEFSTWEEARNIYIDFYYLSMKKIDPSYNKKDKVEEFVDTIMLTSLSRLTDGKGNLHIPKFLKERYAGKYIKGKRK